MILIVDDKPENLVALSKTLESRGFETDTALSGEIALKKILKQSYELVILDVQMPGMDGFEVAEAIGGYSRTKDLPIIFLSAVNVSKEFITKGYASGGRDYLVKPFDTDILVLKIQTFIKLNQMQESLRTEIEHRRIAESRKDDFLSIASHELNTPLTSAKGYVQLAGQALGKSNIDQARLFIDRSQKQLTKLNNLVADLLDTSKIESGKLTFNFSSFELKGFLQGVVESTAHANPGKHVSVTGVDLDGIILHADETRLEQVLLNYLSNAVKYSPESDDVELNISVQDNCLKVNVIDQGIGITPERQKSLFDKFYRVEEHAQRFQGLGMGLYICAEIITRHGGTYGVRSEPGKGSAFHFCIPLSQESPAY